LPCPKEIASGVPVDTEMHGVQKLERMRLPLRLFLSQRQTPYCIDVPM
jgi:hypothetical protein